MTELYIFVEGDDDELFIKSVFNKMLNKCYYSYKFIKYCSKKKEKIRNHIISIDAMKDCDYIFLADQDCNIHKKEKVLRTYNFLNKEKVFIVIIEIESWIIAGVTMEKCRELNFLRTEVNPEKITKELFNSMKSKRDTKIEVITKIYDIYDISEAIRSSPSFKLFHNMLSSKIE